MTRVSGSLPADDMMAMLDVVFIRSESQLMSRGCGVTTDDNRLTLVIGLAQISASVSRRE